jgi:acetyl esterase/lipase
MLGRDPASAISKDEAGYLTPMRVLTRASVVLIGSLAALFASTRASAAEVAAAWTVAQAERPLTALPAVRETRWRTSRAPGGPYDRIEMHRYRGQGPARGVLLYLPGTNMNAEPALTDEDHNLWLFLATRGVEVFALDYRTRFVPASGVTDFGFMKDWDLQSFVGDAKAAAEKARAESGAPRIFVAGFSRGVTLAYALAMAEPRETIAGVVALDGSFKSHAPSGKFDRQAAMKKLEESHAFASDVSGPRGWEWRQRLMQGASEKPKGPAIDAKYATAADELADILYTAWRPGGLANAKEGKSTAAVLGRLLASYDRYYPAVQEVDGRAIADLADDPATTVDDGWGTLKAPVLYFGATGMGVDWLLNGIASAGGAGSPDVTINVLEGYGHLDVVAGDQARRDVFEPLLSWVDKRSNR